MKKVFRWIGIFLLFIVTAVTITTAALQHKTFDAPYPAIRASSDTATIARGKHLVFDIAHCADCHSKANTDSLRQLGQEVPLSGGKLFALPLGNIYTKNITPDAKTGIGNYTDAEVARALRFGVHPNGTAVYDFMPFHNVSNEDMTAIISYLRAQEPVSNKVPAHQLNVLGKIVNAFLVKPVGPSAAIAEQVAPDSTAAYGHYLVNNLAGCGGCHTRRDMSGGITGEAFAGGNPMKKAGFSTLTPPNLTPDKSSRIYGWTQRMFISRFRMGKIIKHSEMPWNAYKYMTDDELKAIYNYLKTVKAAKTVTEN